MIEPCSCCPWCSLPCRQTEHKTGDPCHWPNCLNEHELRTIVARLTEAGVIEASDY